MEEQKEGETPASWRTHCLGDSGEVELVGSEEDEEWGLEQWKSRCAFLELENSLLRLFVLTE